MLRFFAKFQRSRNVVLLLFSILLLVGLVLFYIPNTDLGNNRTASGGEGDVVVAKVGSREILLKDLLAGMQAYGARYGGRFPLTTLKMLGADKEALDGLIAEKMALELASELNAQGTDREVSDAIRAQFTDPSTGNFIGKDEYLKRLAFNGMNPTTFENDLRDSIAARKVRQFLAAGEQVTDKEIEQSYKDENTQVDVVYAILDREKIKDKFSPTEAELRAYYDAHKDDFKATEATRKVDYIFVSTDQVAKTLAISDADLKAEWEKNKQTEYRASVIRLDVLSAADEQTVKTKIDEIANRVKGTATQKGEDFATVAKAVSMDTKTAKSGGDIGWVRKDPNKSGRWEQRVFSLNKVGSIDGPFRDGKSWYLMKTTEERPVPFEALKPTLRAGVANRKAYARASEIADKIYEKATEYKDLRKAAAEFAKELQTTPEAMFKSTPYFKSGDTLPEIGSNQQFENGVKDLKKGSIGDKVGVPNGIAVPQVVDILEKGAQLTFEQASNQVANKLRQEKEPDMARARAQEILDKAKTVAEFQALAKAEGLELKNDTNFNTVTFPGQGADGLQTTQIAKQTLFTLKEGEVAKAPVKFGATGYLIFAATKRTEADLSKIGAAREDIRQRLIGARQQQAYEAFVKSMRQRYEGEGKIKIYQDRIDQAISAAAPAGQ